MRRKRRSTRRNPNTTKRKRRRGKRRGLGRRALARLRRKYGRRHYSVRAASEHGSRLVALRRRYLEAKRAYKSIGSELWKQQTSG